MRTGYAELTGTWTPAAGLTGRAEAGYRLLGNLSGLAYAQWNSQVGPSAGAGLRLDF